MKTDFIQLFSHLVKSKPGLKLIILGSFLLAIIELSLMLSLYPVFNFISNPNSAQLESSVNYIIIEKIRLLAVTG